MVVCGSERVQRPPLHPIPVQKPFQIIGVDIMELPITESGNKYVIVFQDFLTKWPMVFAAPDQKSARIVCLLAEEIVPLFGVPNALLSDRGANLLSHLMRDVCQLLGITKLNTTAPSRPCSERPVPSLDNNGIASYQVFCGHIGTHPMSRRRRSYPSFSWPEVSHGGCLAVCRKH